MRQFLLFMTMAATLLTCCSADEDIQTSSSDQTMNDKGKTLIVFYSYTGDCRRIVNTLASQLKADVLEIQPAEKGLKYDANNYALGTQLLNAINADPSKASSYPAIDPVTTDLGSYDNIVVVTPLWWSRMSAIMQSFLFSHGPKMEGKHVAMVVSSASSNIHQVVSDARRLIPGAIWAGDALWINNSNRSQSSNLISEWLNTLQFDNSSAMTIHISIDGQTKTVTLADNTSAKALYEALQEGPIQYEAHDYGGFEKVGDLHQSFPQNNESITTEAGDIILYQGNNLCIYYGTNSWTFTRIGKIANASQEEIKSFVKAGQGNVNVTLSVGEASEVKMTSGDLQSSDDFFGLDGVRTSNPLKGIYIKNGKKVMK